MRVQAFEGLVISHESARDVLPAEIGAVSAVMRADIFSAKAVATS
jgi:hypothetical protein